MVQKQAPKTVKSLANINDLFNKTMREPAATRAVITMPTKMVLDEDDTTSMVIWKVLQDFKPRTLHEIEKRVISIVSQQEWYDEWMFNKMNIQAVVLQMHNVGNLTRISTTPSNTYVLKEGTPMPLPPQASPKAVKTVVTSTPDGREALDNGNIIVSEGLDLAIWKTFSSLKPLALAEAGEVLFTCGFDRVKAKDRITTLAKRGWFARVGTARLLKYQMKKNIKRPMAEIVKEAPVRKDINVNFKAKPVTPEKVAEIKAAVSGSVMIPEFTGKKSDYSKTKSVNETPVQASLPNLAQVVKSDTIDQAIWKVTSDNNAYSVSDIIVLLQDYLDQNNYKPNYASARVSFLHLEAGWFDRVRVGKAFQYTLKRSVVLPPDRAIRPIAVPPLSPHGLTPTTSSSSISVAVLETMLDRPASSAPIRCLGESEVRGDFRQNAICSESDDELKLVKLSIEIKGVPYNIKQVKEIADGLVDFKTAEAPKNSLLEVRQQFFLSGNALTPDELTDLTNDLVNLGFIN